MQDVLQRMLIFDPKERISWEELFVHPVTRMLEQRIQSDLQEAMGNQDIENVSRFYVRNNRAIDHLEEIAQKQDINNYAV